MRKNHPDGPSLYWQFRLIEKDEYELVTRFNSSQIEEVLVQGISMVFTMYYDILINCNILPFLYDTVVLGRFDWTNQSN